MKTESRFTNATLALFHVLAIGVIGCGSGSGSGSGKRRAEGGASPDGSRDVLVVHDNAASDGAAPAITSLDAHVSSDAVQDMEASFLPTNPDGREADVLVVHDNAASDGAPPATTPLDAHVSSDAVQDMEASFLPTNPDGREAVDTTDTTAADAVATHDSVAIAQGADSPDAGDVPSDAPAVSDSATTNTSWQSAQQAIEAQTNTSVILNWNDLLGSPSLVSFDEPFAVPGSTYDPAHPEDTAHRFLELTRLTWGAQTADAFTPYATVVDPAGPVAVTFYQSFQGVPVYGARLTVLLNKSGQVEFATGGFVPQLSVSVAAQVSVEDASALLTQNGGTVDKSRGSLMIHCGATPPLSATLAWRIPYNLAGQEHVAWIDANGGGLLTDEAEVTPAVFQDVYSSNSINRPFALSAGWDSNTPPSMADGEAFAIFQGVQKFDNFLAGFGFRSFSGQDDWYRSIAAPQYGSAGFFPGSGLVDALANGTSPPSLYGVPMANAPFAAFGSGFSGLDQVSHEWGHGFNYYTGQMAYMTFDQCALHEAIADAIASFVVCAEPSGCTWLVHVQPVDSDRNLKDPSASDGFLTPLPFAENYDGFVKSKQQNNYYRASTAFSHAVYLFACDPGSKDCPSGIGQLKAAAILLRAIWYRSVAPDDWASPASAHLGIVRTCRTLAHHGFDSINQADCDSVDNAFTLLRYPPATSEQALYDVAPLSAPLGIKGVFQQADGSNHISWYYVKGAANFVVYWGISPGITSQSAALVPTTSLTLAQPSVLAGATYYYRVAAKSAVGDEGPLSEEISVVVPLSVPDADASFDLAQELPPPKPNDGSTTGDTGKQDTALAVGDVGIAGTGGIVGTGGVAGTGGIVETGGIVGTGGVVATGGILGTGGSGTGGINCDTGYEVCGSACCAVGMWKDIGSGSGPLPREDHSTVWSGSEMIVWGGYNGGCCLYKDGGRFDPLADWTPTTNSGAPSARQQHTAIWTTGLSSPRMIVWGGTMGTLGTNGMNTGGRYDPVADVWASTSTSGAPCSRFDHTAIWTGIEMIVWGGYSDPSLGCSSTGMSGDGGRYNPLSNSWTTTNLIGAPAGRNSHTAVWSGNEMIVWGGNTGINNTNTGARYRPLSDSWLAISTSGAPSARSGHTAVWTGSEMVVWGGYDSEARLSDGAAYNPTSDTWRLITSVGAPAPRDGHSCVWTGSEMIVWGGSNLAAPLLNDGGRYSPTRDVWSPVASVSAPSGRRGHGAVWTGTRMIIWGGQETTGTSWTGGIFTPP